mmetsp:Transcript_1328/g.3093  ORF Transcript_1328/g.3093 Transcript_1328/m.3093 type:complete len:1754 (-) Transcript_1328:24-5285(-)
MQSILDELAAALNPNLTVSVPFTRKADLMQSACSYLANANRTEVQSFQLKLEGLLTQIQLQGTSAALRKVLTRTHIMLLSQGNSSRVNELCSDNLRLAGQSKSQLSVRLAAIELVAASFEKLCKRMTTPPCAELTELAKKIYRSGETQLKIAVAEALEKMVQAKPVSLHQAYQELTKILVKSLSEKVEGVKAKTASALASLISQFPEIIGPHFDQVLTAIMRNLEHPNQTEFIELFAEVMLSHCKPEIDAHALSRRLIEGLPRTILEAVMFVGQHFYKTGVSHEVRAGLAQGLVIALKKLLKSCALSSLAETTLLFESILMLLGKSQPSDYEQWRVVELVSWVVSSTINTIGELEMRFALDFFLNKLTNLKVSSSEFNLLEIDNSKRPPLSLITEATASICLRGLGDALLKTNLAQFMETEGEQLLRSVRAFLSTNLCKHASRLLRRLSVVFPNVLFDLLKTQIHLTTVAHAELASYQSYTVTRSVLNEGCNVLLGNCLSLGQILQSARYSNRGVPNEIVNASLNTAKALISGQYQSEQIEEVKVNEEGQSLELDTCRKIGGWYLVEGLVAQHSVWVGSHLKLLFTLLKLPFGKKSCEADLTNAQLLLELKHKNAALSALLNFLECQTTLISPQIHNLVSAYLANALQFLQLDKKRKTVLADHTVPGQLQSFCVKVFKCFLKLPVSSYSQKFVTLLYPICNEIANDKISVMPPVGSWIYPEDKYLFNPSSPSSLYSLNLAVFHQESFNMYWREKPCAEWKVPKYTVASECVSTAIQLFCEIFTSSSLNLTNRQQLFKHFLVHMYAAQKLKDSNPVKLSKTVSILLTCVACLKRLAADKGVITDTELINNIRSIFDTTESSNQPIVKCLYSEGSVLLCRVMADPQYIPVFIKEIEHRASMEQSGISVVMIVCNMYRHFPASHIDRNSQMLAHLVQTTSRHPVVGAWAIHALYCIYSKFGPVVEYIAKATLPMAFAHYESDYAADLPFNETMLKLAALHLAKANDRADQSYIRALHVWKDLFKTYDFIELATKFIEAKAPVDFDEILELVYTQLPNKKALAFLLTLIKQGYGLKLLEKQFMIETLFEMTGPYSPPLLGEILKNLVLIGSVNSAEGMITLLKSVISTTHVEESRGNGGMSDLDERSASTNKAPVANKVYSMQARDLAVELLELVVKYSPILSLRQGSTLTACIERLVSIGFGLCSADRDISKRLGAQLLRRLYKKFGSEKDPEDPTLSCLAIYEAQVSAAIRENLGSKDPDVELTTLKLMRSFLIEGTSDRLVWTKVLAPEIAKFPPEAMIPNPSEYNEITATNLYFNRIISICDVVQHSPQALKASVIEQVVPLWPHLKAVIQDLSVVFTQPRQYLKDYKFTLERPVADQSSKHLAHIDWLLSVASNLAVLKEDVKFLASICIAFLFIPFAADREETAFFSQKELDLFFSRRTVLLHSLQNLSSKIKTKRLVDEILQALMKVTEDPDPRNKHQILDICLSLDITDEVSALKADALATALGNEHLQKAGMLKQKCLGLLIKARATTSVAGHFADLCHSRKPDELLSALDSLWTHGEQEFVLALTAGVFDCVCKQWSEDKALALHLDFIGSIEAEKLELCFFCIDYLKEALSRPSFKAYTIVSKFTTGQLKSLLPFLLADIFALLKFRKEGELSQEELQCQAEVLKLLLLQFREAPNKGAIIHQTLSLLFSLFLAQSPPILMTAVCKAVRFVNSQAKEESQSVIQGMPELERKWLEDTIAANLAGRL